MLEAKGYVVYSGLVMNKSSDFTTIMALSKKGKSMFIEIVSNGLSYPNQSQKREIDAVKKNKGEAVVVKSIRNYFNKH